MANCIRFCFLLLRAEPVYDLSFLCSIVRPIQPIVKRGKLHMRLQPAGVAPHDGLQIPDGGLHLSGRAFP